MLPVITIVGRPNVGKSTLFNALTRTRDALVADMPGVTRDRQYGTGSFDKSKYMLIDTGGLVDDAEGIDYLTAQQVHLAIEEADVIMFVVSARDGVTATDEEITRMLRQHGKPVQIVVNKTDGTDTDISVPDFYMLALGEPCGVSAAHRAGLESMMTQIFALLPPWDEPEDLDEVDDDIIRLAVLGRPNVGKSTLVNRLLGEERVLTYDMPGTTRDTIEVELERDGRHYKILDTAGVRRRKNITEAVEKFSVVKALQAIEKSQIIILMIDATDGMTDQDATLLGHVLNQGRGLVIAINKWDCIDAEQRKSLKSELDRRLTYAEFARRITLSALHGSGLRELMNAVNESWRSASLDMPTTRLTEVVRNAWEAHQPAMKHGRTAKLRMAHSGGKFPPRIIIHGRRVDTITPDYRRYISNKIRTAFKLRGTPVWVGFREGKNPFKGNKTKDQQWVPTKKQKKSKVNKRINKSNR
ncbi:MAG: ribosome biogenesis GTPase Der [Proteobacteria bacterium]|nr:ribosome biogenesis GTPase Der [Pseudomonadota bacterium]